MGESLTCPACLAEFRAFVPRCSCGRALGSPEAEAVSLAGFPVLEPHGLPPCAFFLEIEGTHRLRVDGVWQRRAPLGGRTVLVGRSDPVGGWYPDVDLNGVPGSEFVSRRHLQVDQIDERILVTDVAGKQTTALNRPDNRLAAQRPAEIVPGDRLILGESVVIRLVRDDGASGAEA